MCLAAVFAVVANGQPAVVDLADFSLEDLLNIEVTSVSKRNERLFGAPAAIHVITQEDIRRSGLTSLPEILRLSPGVNVAQIDGNKWAITARGFNGQFSSKLLVLIDGRAVYLPSSSGVYWDEQLLMIEDIDRIEVIRGPGATLWGANAVNGVINVITKPSAETQGALVTARTGSADYSVNAARYGGRIGEMGSYRVYSTVTRRSDLPSLQDDRRDARWDTNQGGFRADLTLSARDSLAVSGSIFRETSGVNAEVPLLEPPYQGTFDAPEQTEGGYLVASWQHKRSERSEFTLRGYVDHAVKDTTLLVEDRTTLDLDLQHAWMPDARHDVVWGAGIRYNVTSFGNTQTVAFVPGRQSQRLYSAFVQDEIHLTAETLSVIVGSKLEHNAFTAAEIQPSVRLQWTPSTRSTAWAAVSRAVRTPAYFDESSDLALAAFPTPGGVPASVRLLGSTQIPVETVRAHEVGFRRRAGRKLSLDWTAFYNVYGRLRTYEPRQPFPSSTPAPFHLVIPLVADAKMRGESLGTEIAAGLDLSRRWRINAAYSWFNLQLHLDPFSQDSLNELSEGSTPRHQVQFRSEMDLSRKVQFDTYVYYVSALMAGAIPSYTRADARLGWRPTEILEISVGGQNLQGGRHLEFLSEGPYGASRVGRSLYAGFRWMF